MMYLARMEAENFIQMVQEHLKNCVSKPYRDISLEQSSKSGIGTNTYVECGCGWKQDITDCRLW
jgi:hypothetical protein